MMKERYAVVALLILINMLTACASKQIATDRALDVPSRRILDTSYLKEKPGTVAVTVKRDAIWQCPRVYVRIFVDTVPVADLRSEEKVIMHLPEGTHILGGQPYGVCGGHLLETSTVVKDGAPLLFRAGFSEKGEFLLTPSL